MTPGPSFLSSHCGSVGPTCASGSRADFLLPGVKAGGLRLSRVHSGRPCGLCKRSKVRDRPGREDRPAACFASSTYLHWLLGTRQTLPPWPSLFSVGERKWRCTSFPPVPQRPPTTQEPHARPGGAPRAGLIGRQPQAPLIPDPDPLHVCPVMYSASRTSL